MVIECKTSEYVFRQRVLGYVGVPRIFHSDNGGEFNNQFVAALLDQWQDKDNPHIHINGRPRHPASQGVVERANGTISDKLSARFHDWNEEAKGPAPWADWLPEVMCESKQFYVFVNA